MTQKQQEPGRIIPIKLRIDTHVHCRDDEQSYKATIGSVMKTAKRNGVSIIFDMPNCKRPVISEERVLQRLELADRQGCLDDYYLWGGLSKDPKQIEHIAGVAISNRKVVGLKMYAGKSVGDLTVPDEADQAEVYGRLVQIGYTGVIGVHCEKEKHFHLDLWNPKDPRTWNDARPPESETESIKDQIRFTRAAGFKGTLHICHISTPEGVELVQQERIKGGLRITCGVTPSHVLLSTNFLEGEQGLLYKVNPPIRDAVRAAKMLHYLKIGWIDWIETDHAPHTEEEKLRRTTDGEHMSGIQALLFHSVLLDKLRKEGMPEAQIDDLTYNNLKKTFPMVVQ